EQFDLDVDAPEKPILELLPPLEMVRDEDRGLYRITGNDFEFAVDDTTGLIQSIEKAGVKIGSTSPDVHLWRAPVDNDWGVRGRDSAPLMGGGLGFGEGIAWDWMELGLEQLTVQIDSISVEQVSREQVGVSVYGVLLGDGIAFDFETDFNFFGTGDVVVERRLRVPYNLGWLQWAAILALAFWVFSKRVGRRTGWSRRWLIRIPFILVTLGLVLYLGFSAYSFFKVTPLPRVGSQFKLGQGFDQMRWYGRGPFENYSDRNLGSPYGVYEGSVSEQFVPYVHPQENGNKTDTRWVTLTDPAGMGILVEGDDMSVSAHHYTLESLSRAGHVPDLKKGDYLTLNIDLAQSGVGTDFMGSPPLDEFLLDAREYRLRYRFRAIDLSSDDLRPILRTRLP
ncbi:MAG: hypothetical protein JSU96_14955, partial [Acidobacteriota bacterium]